MSCKSFKKNLESPFATRKCLESPRNAIEPISPPPLLAQTGPLNGTASTNLNWSTKEDGRCAYGVSCGTALFTSRKIGEALGEGNNTIVSTGLMETKSSSDDPQSPMNVLATVALATSSTFVSHHTAPKLSDSLSGKSPLRRFHQNTSGGNKHSRYDADGRPFKRARSEVLYPSQSQGSEIRPSTSYALFENWLEHDFRLNGVNQKKRRGSGVRHTRSLSSEVASGKQFLEAELLLGFSRGGSISSPGKLGTETTSQLRNVKEQTLSAQEKGHLHQAMALPFASGNLDSKANKLSYLCANEADQLVIKSEGSTHLSLNNGSNDELLKIVAKNAEFIGVPSRNSYSKNLKIKRENAIYRNANGVRETRPNHGSKSIEKNGLHGRQMSQPRDASTLCSIHSKTQIPDMNRRRAVSAPPNARYYIVPLVKARAKSVPARGFEALEKFRDSTASVRKGTKRTSKRAIVANACSGCLLLSRSMSYENDKWICCNGCKGWYHYRCAGFNSEREVRSVHKFYCKGCESIHGSSTFVRKSGRAHSAVDYAGLNEGVLRTSDESPEHHYIRSIKDATFKFIPDNFARMRPELVTASFFEKCGGITEPFIIPATWNPRTLYSDKKAPLDHIGSMRWPPSGDFEFEVVADNGQDNLDMVIPHQLTVRQVADLYGAEEKVEVIDVKSQEGEDRRWNMRKWVDYYEEDREKVIRNVISLEVSASKLGRLIRRPQIVRELDLQDDVWPEEEISNGFYPKVQFYCLMSVADCYTDFHIDFGGSSVYYHILKGKKTFLFIPPTKQNLKKYEDWCLSENQNWTFLPDVTKECYRVDLSTGDTMIIPSGWIHAVWTPENSLVIGGNFLTRLHYEMQIRIAEIEKNTKVPRKFRYPHFQKLMWYTAIRYLKQDPLPLEVQNELCQGGVYSRSRPIYEEWDKFGHNSNNGTDKYNSRYYSRPELDGLPELARYLFRTVMISRGTVEGISAEVKNAVTRSIPKGQGEPIALIRSFAMWIAWKRGNEPIPQWARLNSETSVTANVNNGKKLSVAALKRLESQANQSPVRKNSKRNSARSTLKAAKNTLGNALTAKTSAQVQISNGSQYLSPEEIEASGDSSAVNPSSISMSKYMLCDNTDTSKYFEKERKSLDGIFSSLTPTQTSLAENRDLQQKSSDHDQKIPSFQQVSSVPYKSSIGNASLDMPNLVNISVIQPDHDKADTGESLDGVYANVVSIQEFSPPSKRGRGKACSDCRRSKRRCIHDENDTTNNINLQTLYLPNREYVQKPEHLKKNGLVSTTTKIIQREGIEQRLLSNSSISQGKGAFQGTLVKRSTDIRSKGSTATMENSICTTKMDTSANTTLKWAPRSATCAAIVRQKDRAVTANKYEKSHEFNNGVEAPNLTHTLSDVENISVQSETLSSRSEIYENLAITELKNKDCNHAKNNDLTSGRCNSREEEPNIYEQPSNKSLAAHVSLYQGSSQAGESSVDTPSGISLLQQTGKDTSNSKSDIATCQAIKPSEDDNLRLVRLLATSEFSLRRRI